MELTTQPSQSFLDVLENLEKSATENGAITFANIRQIVGDVKAGKWADMPKDVASIVAGLESLAVEAMMIKNIFVHHTKDSVRTGA